MRGLRLFQFVPFSAIIDRMETQEFFQTLDDGAEIFVTRCVPSGDVKGIVHLCHGMVEHIGRYAGLGAALAENGWLFSAHDMRGHGKTAARAEQNGTGMFGMLAKKNGFERAALDARDCVQKLKADFPGKKVVLLGHSFGSFIAQYFIENYAADIDGCVLCGTAGPRIPLVTAGGALAGAIAMFRGNAHHSRLLQKMAFGSYNERIPDAKTGDDWLTRDAEAVARYREDDWCGFNPTASFYRDMMRGLRVIHADKNMRRIPSTLPVLIIYGGGDPVGGYGKTVEKLCAIYRKNGMTRVAVKEYPGARHELFNETNRKEVEDDLIAWLETVAR